MKKILLILFVLLNLSAFAAADLTLPNGMLYPNNGDSNNNVTGIYILRNSKQTLKIGIK